MAPSRGCLSQAPCSWVMAPSLWDSTQVTVPPPRRVLTDKAAFSSFPFPPCGPETVTLVAAMGPRWSLHAGGNPAGGCWMPLSSLRSAVHLGCWARALVSWCVSKCHRLVAHNNGNAAPGSRSPKSRCGQGPTPSGGSGGGSFLASFLFWWLWVSPGIPGLRLHHSASASVVTRPSASPVCPGVSVFSFCKDTCHWIETYVCTFNQ